VIEPVKRQGLESATKPCSLLAPRESRAITLEATGVFSGLLFASQRPWGKWQATRWPGETSVSFGSVSPSLQMAGSPFS
jgi:hypothetical protein